MSRTQDLPGAVLPGAIAPDLEASLTEGLMDARHGPVLQAVVCPTGGDHPMLWTSEASYDIYICNQCRTVGTGERWHCDVHQVDYCEMCWPCWPRDDELGSTASVWSDRPVSPATPTASRAFDPAPTEPGHVAYLQSERLRRLLDPRGRSLRSRSQMHQRAEAAAAPTSRSERMNPQEWSRPWRSACSTSCRTSPRKETRSVQIFSVQESPESHAGEKRMSASLAAPAPDSPEEFAALERELAELDCSAEREAAPQSDGSSRFTGMSCTTNISLQDMRTVRAAFYRYDFDRDGFLTHEEFQSAINDLLGGSVSEDESIRKAKDAAWRDADRSGNGTVDIREFFQWYCLNGFNIDLLLTDDQKYLRRIAKTYHVNVNTVDSIKYYFDMYDSDGSGFIEFEEFQQIVHKLMRVPANQVLPLTRMQYFWSELDADQSGTVEFEEFLCWWLNNFDDFWCEAQHKRAPFESFYGQIRKLGKRLRETTVEKAAQEGKRSSVTSIPSKILTTSGYL